MHNNVAACTLREEAVSIVDEITPVCVVDGAGSTVVRVYCSHRSLRFSIQFDELSVKD